jgi:hypothetical protein
VAGAACAAFPVTAQPPSHTDLLEPREADAIIWACAAASSWASSLSATFEVTHERSLEVGIPDEHMPPSEVHGTLLWYRADNVERIELRFDLPPKQKRGMYEDQLIVDDGSVRYVEILRTGQAALVSHDTEVCLGPRSLCAIGFLRSIDELLDNPRIRYRMQRPTDEQALLHVEMLGDDFPLALDCTLDAAYDWAITEWVCPLWHTRGEFHYARTESGAIAPTRIVHTVSSGEDGGVLRRVSLHVARLALGPPEDDVFHIPLRPGLVLADNRDEQVKLLEVDESGSLIEVEGVSMRSASLNARTLVLGGAGLLAVIAVVVRRILAMRQRCAALN